MVRRNERRPRTEFERFLTVGLDEAPARQAPDEPERRTLELFGESRLPTLAQYDPRSRLFEVHDGTLLFTGDNGIPLIRYHIADTGGLTSTVSYFGANIYPENISVGLEQPPVAAWVTGKFVMESREDADRYRYLAIAVELAPGVAGTEQMRRGIAQSIVDSLRRLNSEFAHYTPPEHQLPRISLHPAGDPDYFPPGVKHRYSR